MLLYYIRHADPVYSPDSLTPLGKKQADAVGKRLEASGIDKIFASSSNRAKMTASPLSELIKKPITVLDWCNENYAWQEFSKTQENGETEWIYNIPSVKEKFCSKEILSLGNSWYHHPFFDEKVGKGVERINRETDKFLSDFGLEHDRETGTYFVKENCEEKVALFAHYGFGMAFLSSVLDIPYPLFSIRTSINHSGISVIELKGKKGDKIIPRMLVHSSESHLYKEGIPTKYNNEFLV